ncbi:MAG: TIGR04255 family protein [Nitrospirae bacterium]|nr:TIGR04255 family protein [Nitrospirota bacterium]
MEIDKIQYVSNYLQRVLFKLDFSPILLLVEGLNPAFQETLRRGKFPKFEEQNRVALQLDVQKEVKMDEMKKIYKVWNFENKEKSYKIIVCSNYFALECFKYHHFEEFFDILKSVFSSFYSFYKPLDCKRLGLRYINKIEISEGHPLEWSEFITAPFTYSIEHFIGDNLELSRAMSQFTLNRDNYNIIVNFGINNDEYPSRISRKEFILDYDCYTQDVEENSIEENIDKFHIEIQKLFENSVTDKLRNIMEVKNV